MKTFTQRIQLNKSIIRKPTFLIVIAAIIAYHGAPFLGLAMDDYFNIECYASKPLYVIATLPVFNRFPLFALIIYPILLQLPLWVSHSLIIVIHTLSALFLNKLLRWFNCAPFMAAFASLLFLVWPAPAEALFWLVASTVIFGGCFVLGGTLLLTKDKYILGIATIFVGLLFSEGLFFPSLFLVGVVLLFKKTSLQRTGILLAALIFLYAAFQFARRLVSVEGGVTQYQIGFGKIASNTKDLIVMSLGLASSRDVAWMWLKTIYLIDVSILLSPGFLVVAIFVSLPFVYILWKKSRSNESLATQKQLQFLGVACVGYISSLAIFMIVAGNDMQTRYTYTGVAYLSVIVAFLISRLVYTQNRLFPFVGMLAATLLLGWSFYHTWSNVWVNWYEAKIVSERIIEDVRDVYKQTGSQRILLVDDPKSVGSAYAISRDWGYKSVAHLYISPDLDLSADRLPALFSKPNFGIGSRFSLEKCVFLGWKEGRTIVSTNVLSPDAKLVLNCENGLVEPSSQENTAAILLQYTLAPSSESLPSFLNTPVEKLP